MAVQKVVLPPKSFPLVDSSFILERGWSQVWDGLAAYGDAIAAVELRCTALETRCTTLETVVADLTNRVKVLEAK